MAKKEKKENKKDDKKKDEKKKEKESKEEEKEVEVPKKFKDLVKEIEGLSVLELSELVSVLEDKFGVSAAAPAVAAAPVAGGNGGGEEEEERSNYDVELKSIGQKKIEVIKAVRDITGKGLKDAKELVDSAADSPQTIKDGVPTEKANEMKEKLEEAGAEVELK